MEKRILVFFYFLLIHAVTFTARAQDAPLNTITHRQKKTSTHQPRCSTMEAMQESIRKDPTLPEKWKIEGERQYNLYLERTQKSTARALHTLANTIVIPIVFHLVDDGATLASISDRDIVEQVEILNHNYNGRKINDYLQVIPSAIASRLGQVNLRFVLARRDPAGALTTGIERRANATPDHISVKSFSTGGLDAWDSSKYLNVWCGTFTSADAGLLGISTFPFTTDEGPQGCVIGIKTLPYAGNTTRSYYAEYSEGCTLSHEIGHYFYLWHTFGDQSSCNNSDFKIQAGWPLPVGAGPEGDDSPKEKGTGSDNFVYGNPSMNYSDGCATESFGMMYGSFMNYFDDRAMFMFSDGMRQRVEGCISLYRSGLLSSDGAVPPLPVTDAFLVDLSPRGNRERKSFIVNNTPLQAVVRNNGSLPLTSVTIDVAIDGGSPLSSLFPLNLDAGADTTLNLAPITGSIGSHVFTIYTSSPNGSTDDFTDNDTIVSYVHILDSSTSLPFSEDFSLPTFPPAGWTLWNPNGGSNKTWARSGPSGATNAGSAVVNNFGIDEIGSLDELITPAINLDTTASAQLNFKVAYTPVDSLDVSTWDGLEVYVSGDGGKTFHLAYKKTGLQLATTTVTADSFVAAPSEQSKWRSESIRLTPFIIPGQEMIIKFRNLNAFGNNLYLDDIGVSAICESCTRDLQVVSITNPRSIECNGQVTPAAVVRNNAVDTITSFDITYQVDNGVPQTISIIGIQLPRDSSFEVPLASMNVGVGMHTIRVYTSNPVATTGTGDLFTANDTLIKEFGIAGTGTAPLKEGFESPGLLPLGWVAVNPDADITWIKINPGNNSSASAYVNNYNYPLPGRIDDLYTRVVTYPVVDSVLLSFDMAAAGFSTGLPTDTLEVLLTKDCGTTFTSVYKKWGTALRTVGTVQPGEFFPSSSPDWRTETIDLSTLAPSGPVQIVFRNTNNHGNNIFIDNVNLKTRILPGRLKREGVLILPNPFRDQFTVWHFLPPADLRSISVYNTSGQLILSKGFSGNAGKLETVDLRSAAAGMYIVRLVYSDNNHNTAIKVVKY